MKVLVMMDSFKESLTSLEAGDAVKAGILRVKKDAQVTVKCLADGGEGTTKAILQAITYKEEIVKVSNPLGKEIEASYGITEAGVAVMEMAASSGLGLLLKAEQNPLYTSTYGFGEMIADAVKKGVRKFILGIGGSATNDCGLGMLAALGYRFWNKDSKEVMVNPKTFDLHLMSEIMSVTDDTVLPELKDCQFTVACDVTNPLCGELGATAIFGPQKGLATELINEIDEMLTRFARVVSKDIFDNQKQTENSNIRQTENEKSMRQSKNSDLILTPGTGAAGGLGFALLTMLDAELKSGIDIILDTATMPEDFAVDILITGEGRLDGQSAMGKGPVGVVKHCLRIAKKKPLILAFAGSVTKDAKTLNEVGIDAYFPVVRGITTLEDALKNANAKENIADSVEQVFRLISL